VAPSTLLPKKSKKIFEANEEKKEGKLPRKLMKILTQKSFHFFVFVPLSFASSSSSSCLDFNG
jgi:hypothetical protein